MDFGWLRTVNTVLVRGGEIKSDGLRNEYVVFGFIVEPRHWRGYRRDIIVVHILAIAINIHLERCVTIDRHCRPLQVLNLHKSYVEIT